MSLRARLVVVLAGLAVAGLIAVDVATYAALRSFLIERVDASLAATTRDVERSLSQRGRGRGADLNRLATQAPGVFVQLRDPSGRTVWSGVFRRRGELPPLPDLPSRLRPAAFAPTTMTVDARTGGTQFRARAQRLVSGEILLVAAPLDDVAATLRRLALIEALVSIAVIGAVVLLGLWLVRLGLRPLRTIEQTSAAIAAGDLGRRIDGADARTEIGRLGLALNAMLQQIESAFSERAASERRLRRFVADASHELRTPLASVKAYAELFERGARDRPADLARAMAGIERESRRMALLVDDLLLLARIDQGRPLEREEVDLSAVASDAVDAARALEPERPIRLVAPAHFTVVGDPTRLRQVLDNLLANVRAHTPVSAAATVRIGRQGPAALLEVDDRGPGLDREQIARVFERFYRGEPSRARAAAGGSGLGLAIVAAIAEAHSGHATVGSATGGGARFSVWIPIGAGEGAPAAPSPAVEASAVR